MVEWIYNLLLGGLVDNRNAQLSTGGRFCYFFISGSSFKIPRRIASARDIPSCFAYASKTSRQRSSSLTCCEVPLGLLVGRPVLGDISSPLFFVAHNYSILMGHKCQALFPLFVPAFVKILSQPIQVALAGVVPQGDGRNAVLPAHHLPQGSTVRPSAFA